MSLRGARPSNKCASHKAWSYNDHATDTPNVNALCVLGVRDGLTQVREAKNVITVWEHCSATAQLLRYQHSSEHRPKTQHHMGCRGEKQLRPSQAQYTCKAGCSHRPVLERKRKQIVKSQLMQFAIPRGKRKALKKDLVLYFHMHLPFCYRAELPLLW